MENKVHYFILKNKEIRYLCNQQSTEVYENKITNDYFKITCKKCKDILEIDILKVTVKNRTEGEHGVLIKRFGGVRKYLLSMGKFNDIKKRNENRIVLVDHHGVKYEAWNVEIEEHIQDNNRTLKLFVKKKASTGVGQ